MEQPAQLEPGVKRKLSGLTHEKRDALIFHLTGLHW